MTNNVKTIIRIRLGKAYAKHAYELTVCAGTVANWGKRFAITVDANNRAQATRIAEKAGYYVGDCNMIG